MLNFLCFITIIDGMYSQRDHHKSYDWALILPYRIKSAKPQLLMLTKANALLRTHKLGKNQLNPVALAHILINIKENNYATIHGVLSTHDFPLLAHQLKRFARVSLWSESLLLCEAGGQDSRFFNLYYHLIHWLNQPQLPAHWLDNLFFYYFLLLNGVLEANNTRYCPNPLTFAQLTQLEDQLLYNYLSQWHQNPSYFQQLYQCFTHFMPSPPQSLKSLTHYDAP